MEIGLFEAKNRLSELVSLAEGGTEVVITRRGQPVAKLVPAATVRDKAAVRAAVERIAKIGDEMTGPPITVDEIIAWKNEGRR